VRDLEIGKFLEIGEFDVSDASNSLSNRFVKGNDTAVDAGMSN